MADIENCVASEVHVERFTSKRSRNQEIAGCSKKYIYIFFPCADGSLRQEGHAQRQTERHHGGASFDAKGSTLNFARGEKKAELRIFLKLIATLRKLRKCSGVCLVNYSIARTLCPEKNGKTLSVIIRNESIIDVLWNIDEHGILSEGYSWADGRLTKTQITSILESIWPEVLSFISNCEDMITVLLYLSCVREPVEGAQTPGCERTWF